MAGKYSLMSVRVDTNCGEAFDVTCNLMDTILNIKHKISITEANIPVERQHLIWLGKELENTKTLDYYGIQDGSTLKLILSLQVGAASFQKVEHEMLIDWAHFVQNYKDTDDYEVLDPAAAPTEDMQFYFPPEQDTELLVESTDLDREMATVCENLKEFVDNNKQEENERMKSKIATLTDKMRTCRIERAKRAYPNESSEEDIEKIRFLSQFGLVPRSYVEKKRETEAANKDVSEVKSQKNTLDLNNIHEFSAFSSENIITTHDISDPQTSSTVPLLKSSYDHLEGGEKNSSISKNMLAASNNPCNETASSFVYPRDTSILNDFIVDSPLNTFSENVRPICKVKHFKVLGTESEDSSIGEFSNLDEWLNNRPKTMPLENLHHELDSIIQSQTKKFSTMFNEDWNMLHEAMDENHEVMDKDHKVMDRDKKEMPHSAFSSVPSHKPSIVAQSRSVLRKPKHHRKQSASDSSKSILPKLNKDFTESKGVDLTEMVPDASPESESPRSKSAKVDVMPENAGAVPKLPSINKKKKKRCFWCKKRIGLTSTYSCRCGKEFCGPHRYPETHDCTFDYRAEGERALRLKSHSIAAPKLPKI